MSQTPMSGRSIKTNGVRLHVVEQGEGPAVVFCQGFPGGWRSWRWQMRAISDAGFRTVAFDMRSYGDSSAPPEAMDYSLFKIARDIAGLCEALKFENVCLAGHDLGAALVGTASLMRPDIFRAVFGVNVPPEFVVAPNSLAETRRQGKNDFYMFRLRSISAKTAPTCSMARPMTKAGSMPFWSERRRMPWRSNCSNRLTSWTPWKSSQLAVFRRECSYRCATFGFQNDKRSIQPGARTPARSGQHSTAAGYANTDGSFRSCREHADLFMH